MGTKGSAETEEKPGSSQDTPDKDDDVFWDKVYRATKIVFSGLLFLLVLSSAVVSKGALLVLTWNIFTPFNTTKPVLKTLGGHFQYRTNSKNGTNQQDITAGFTKTNVYFVWATFLVVVTPYLLSIMVNLWKVLSKKSGELRWIPLLIAIVTAIVHSVGLSIFVFSLLPAFDPISGVFYGATITCVPSLVHIVFSDKTLLIKQTGVSTKVVWPFVGRILAFIFSIISLICWCVYVYRASSPSVSVASLFMFVFAPVLVSCGWWENFGPELHPTVTSEAAIPESDAKTDKSQARPMQSSNIPVEEADTSKSEEKSNNIETFWRHIYILKDQTYTGRYKIYLLVNICKVIVTFAMLVGIYGRHCFEFSPVTNGTSVNQVSNGFASTWFYSWDTCTRSVPFTIAGVAVFTCLICHRLSLAAIKIVAQIQSFSLPVVLTTPVAAVTVYIVSTQLQEGLDYCTFPFPWWDCDGSTPDIYYMVVASATGYISLILLTSHIWTNNIERMMKGNEIYLKSLYCGSLFDQSLLLNRRRQLQTLDESTVKLNRNGKVHPEEEATRERKQSINADPVPMIYLCATMWHETELEMKQLLKSLFRMDKDQWDISRCTEHPDRYNFEAHIFFDDAFIKNSSCANEFVQTFDTALKSLTSTSKNKTMKTLPKEVTPYGGKLKWILPYGNKLIAHLKDEKKIRKKKRWSQVMYMYYFLSYKLGVNYKEKEFEMEREFEKLKEKAKNIFILALDGDVDFKPAAVKLLVDRMKRNEEVGAACGRIHPIGEGPMVWYQKFEYAVSHWLVKATEHVAGCVLCSPGCFSLFRGSSLMDAKVLKVYTTSSTEARHHIQYDQGEDRWLCTLLLKQGYKIDYCAASDAYTFAPEEFKVFFNQRRRWTPSTMANIMDLLSDWRSVTKRNNYVTLPYIGLQAFWFLSSLVTPGVLLLMIVGAINLIYPDLSLTGTLLINLIPIVVFVLLCFFGSTDHQLNFAAALSVVYSLVMMIVLIGLIKQSVDQGFCSITTPFFLSVCGIFVITGLMHPQEMSCLLHGLLFFIAIPSMSILLMIYSIINMNNVSWGTREAQQILAKGHISSKNRFQSFLDKIGCSSIPQDQNNEDIEGQPQQDEHVHKASLSFEREGTRNREEDEFWKWLINTYLHPSGSCPNTDIDEEEESRCIEENLKKKELELKHLRNKASLAFLLINGIFTTTLFFLQQINADNKGDLSIQLTCLDGRSLHLEPISMTFTLVFGILLTVQFVCMIVHRFKTFLQINSITRIRQHPDIDSLCLDIGDEQKEDEHHDDCIKQDTSAENENALGPLERTNAKKKTKSKGKKKKYRRSNTSNVEPSTSDQVLSRVDQKEKNDIDSVGGKYNTIPVQSTFTAKTPLPDIARSYPLPDIHIKHNAENQSCLDIPLVNT